jgi:DNA repair protein RecN (Recombination protein N)
MLQSLHISNYALIDSLDIDFHAGFNIITGETGAGKSIMLGALSLLMGGRADSKVVRDATRKSVIEAIFEIGNYPTIHEYFVANDIEWDASQCILRREIAPAGRSRAFINDSPVTLTILETVSRQLIDIHSQHQNQLLQDAEYQLTVIDNLAGNQELLTEYRRRYNAYRESLHRYNAMRREIEKNVGDEEFMRFQLGQFEELDLVDGEQEELERERTILTNMSEIKSTLNDALDALANANDNALSQIAAAATCCDDLSTSIEEASSLSERLESARIEIQDIVETLSEYDSNLQADPAELDSIEERLNAIYTLQHRHKVTTIAELIAIRDDLRKRIDDIENSDSNIEELHKEVKRARALARESAQALSTRRQEEALSFAEELRHCAMPLGMKNLCCKVSVEPADMSATGIDNVRFLFAFNKNQPLMAVSGAASGGEISRLMLSIKTIIARKMQLPSIIFDEIDTGVSGDVANRMGDMMDEISTNIQVIAITHLPQVAAKGRHHYKVYKEDDEHATHTRIKELSAEARIEELTLMLSGSTTNEAARANAKELLSAKH